jgi:hypothetical protein
VSLKEKQRVSATRTSRDTLFDECGIVTFDAKVRVSDLSTTAQTAIARAIDHAAKLRDKFYVSLQLELRVRFAGGLRDAREAVEQRFQSTLGSDRFGQVDSFKIGGMQAASEMLAQQLATDVLNCSVANLPRAFAHMAHSFSMTQLVALPFSTVEAAATKALGRFVVTTFLYIESLRGQLYTRLIFDLCGRFDIFFVTSCVIVLAFCSVHSTQQTSFSEKHKREEKPFFSSSEKNNFSLSLSLSLDMNDNALLQSLAASAQSTAAALDRLTTVSEAQALAMSAQAAAADATRQAREAEVHTANLAKEAKWRQEAVENCPKLIEFLARLCSPNRAPGAPVQFKFIRDVLFEVASFWRHHEQPRRKLALAAWLEHARFGARFTIPAPLREFDGQFAAEHGPAWFFEILAAAAVPQVSLSVELDLLPERSLLGQLFVEVQPLLEFCVLQRCRHQPAVAPDHVRAGVEADVAQFLIALIKPEPWAAGTLAMLASVGDRFAGVAPVSLASVCASAVGSSHAVVPLRWPASRNASNKTGASADKASQKYSGGVGVVLASLAVVDSAAWSDAPDDGVRWRRHSEIDASDMLDAVADDESSLHERLDALASVGLAAMPSGIASASISCAGQAASQSRWRRRSTRARRSR